MRKIVWILAFLLIGVQAETEGKTSFQIDPTHSSVEFKIRHLAISSVAGKFGKFSGVIDFDPKTIASSKVEAVIEAGSVDTDNAKRDDHLRSEDFFAAQQYPSLKFVSTEVKPASERTFQVLGNLEMHGIQKPVILNVEYLGGAVDPAGQQRVGFTATTKLHRKDFGLQWNKVLETGALVVGDEVAITLEIEAVEKK
jgi:polyisoprenoid-binding protein YceI